MLVRSWLRKRENPAALPQLATLPVPEHQPHHERLEDAAKEQNKTLCLTTHGTDSAHCVPLFPVPDVTLKESNFSFTGYPDHIVFPLGLLLKQLFTTSVNTLKIGSYTTIICGLYPSLLCFFNTGKMVQIFNHVLKQWEKHQWLNELRREEKPLCWNTESGLCH